MDGAVGVRLTPRLQLVSYLLECGLTYAQAKKALELAEAITESNDEGPVDRASL